MKRFGLLIAGLTLLVLGAAPGPDDKAKAPLLEPRDDNGKLILKLPRVDYDEDRKVVIFLLELQADIGFDEKLSIDKAWYASGSSAGVGAYFFDKEGVALYAREIR